MSARDKIKPLPDLATTLAGLRGQGRKVVHCHGVFDLLHVGHLRYFEEARAMGDVLVVTLTTDKHVNKGPHRPAFTEQLRVEVAREGDHGVVRVANDQHVGRLVRANQVRGIPRA